MTEDEAYRRAKVYALNRLSAKAYLTKDLRDSMKRKEFLSEHIERILEECRQLGYLNDDEWLDGYVRGLISKKKGPQAIKSKLFLKGFSREKIQEVVEGLDSQTESIFELLKTKYRNKDLSNFKEKQKVIASLARRGFSFNDILACLKVDAEFDD